MSWSNASKKYYYSDKGKIARLKYQKSDKAKEVRRRYQERLKLKKEKAKENLKKQDKPINNIITVKQKIAPTKKLKK